MQQCCAARWAMPVQGASGCLGASSCVLGRLPCSAICWKPSLPRALPASGWEPEVVEPVFLAKFPDIGNVAKLHQGRVSWISGKGSLSESGQTLERAVAMVTSCWSSTAFGQRLQT